METSFHGSHRYEICAENDFKINKPRGEKIKMKKSSHKKVLTITAIKGDVLIFIIFHNIFLFSHTQNLSNS